MAASAAPGHIARGTKASTNAAEPFARSPSAAARRAYTFGMSTVALDLPLASPFPAYRVLPDDLLRLQTKESAGGTIHIGHLAFRIQQDDALLQGLEDLF